MVRTIGSLPPPPQKKKRNTKPLSSTSSNSSAPSLGNLESVHPPTRLARYNLSPPQLHTTPAREKLQVQVSSFNSRHVPHNPSLSLHIDSHQFIVYMIFFLSPSPVSKLRRRVNTPAGLRPRVTKRKEESEREKKKKNSAEV